MQIVLGSMPRPGAQPTLIAADGAHGRQAGATGHFREQPDQRQRLVRHVIGGERHAHHDVEVLVNHARAGDAAFKVARHELLQDPVLVVIGEGHAVAFGPVNDFGRLIEGNLLLDRLGATAPQLAYRLPRHAEHALCLLMFVLQYGRVALVQQVGHFVERRATHERVGCECIAIVSMELEVAGF